MHSVGESAEDEGLIFKVTGLREVQEIPVGQYAYPARPIRPAKGAKLVLATVVWKNDTDESADNFCGGAGAKLLDQENRNFDPIERQIDIRRNTICSKEIQPGFKVRQYLGFEMPSDAEIGGLRPLDLRRRQSGLALRQQLASEQQRQPARVEPVGLRLPPATPQRGCRPGSTRWTSNP